MPRCGNCGKANRDGALFCQDCGQRIDAAGGPAQAAIPVAIQAQPQVQLQVQPGGMAMAGGQAAGRQGGPSCPSCGTMNPVGMNFCKMCGTALGGGAPRVQVSAAPAPGRVACAQCGKHTPAGYAFCQHCGHRLAAQSESAAGNPASAMVAGVINRGPVVDKSMPPMPTPPAGVRAPMSAAPAPMAVQARGGAPGPASGHAAGYHGQQGAVTSMPLNGPGSGAGNGLLGRLIAIRRDGTDGDVIPLGGESFDIGRTEGSLCFSEDPFLAPRHARFIAYGGVVRVRPLDTVNGVFLRLRDPHDLQPGDIIYIGKELLRFESLAQEERDPPSLVEHGVRLFGSAPRESWARLRQLTCAGTTRDLWYLSRAEIVLGREEGDITFPDDEFMSRRHAVLARAGTRARLIDQNSSNGTYLRLRGDRELRPSDVLRMGDQLLRFEP